MNKHDFKKLNRKHHYISKRNENDCNRTLWAILCHENQELRHDEKIVKKKKREKKT